MENKEPNFDSPKSVLSWWGELTLDNYQKMVSNRTKSETRQRLLNQILDSWSRGYKLLNEAETIEDLRSRLEALEDYQELRAVK